MHLIVGLGNPGPRYTLTRHNIGALTLSRAATTWAVSWQEARYAWWGKGRVGSVDVILAVPSVWMNQSGPAVHALLDRHALSPQDLVLVHDDLDLPLGRLRIKRTSGPGGHNGVLSVLTALGTEDVSRVKIGIGTPPAGHDPADYVLSPFLKDELVQVEPVLERAILALESLVGEGLEAAMNRFNIRSLES